METSSEASVLQKLLNRLCHKTTPGKIYKTLKELFSLPILLDTLAEIDFKQTIKSLKKQQLLMPFVKDLVAKWSTGFLLGPQLQQARQDFGFEKGLTTKGRNTSPEEKPQKSNHLATHMRCPLPGENWSPELQQDGKRKRWEPLSPAKAQGPSAKVPRGETGSSMDLSPNAACAIPEAHSSDVSWFKWNLAQQDQEASSYGWALRKNHRTQVYSACRPAARLQQKHTGTRDSAHCHIGKDKAGCGQPEEKSWAKGHRCKESYSHPESPTPLQVQGSQEERLQALRARLQSTRAKRPQPRQTMMVSFFTQLKSPSQQGKPGKTGAASVQNQHSLSEDPAHPGAQWASCPLPGETGTKKAPAKRPAPLMILSTTRKPSPPETWIDLTHICCPSGTGTWYTLVFLLQTDFLTANLGLLPGLIYRIFHTLSFSHVKL
uniref:Uncharacterized protein n=1 Tax=Mus spicilegus TaxID=10103 RepID=A0A8C6HNG0_MUSSI